MTEISLQLQFTPHPQRPACARFIPGSAPAHWLDELTTWDIPLDQLRLYPLSKSQSDNTCLGVLVSGVSGSEQGSVPRPQTQPYGCLAGRLFLPVEAALSVTLQDGDWRNLLGPTGTEYVWHPQAGLVAFEPDEILSVTQLLSPQAPNENVEQGGSSWGFAHPGVIFLNRITSVRAELPATATDMLVSGRDGIGTQAKRFQDLPVPVAEKIASWGKSAIGLVLLPVAMLTSFIANLLVGSGRKAITPTNTTGSMSTGLPAGAWVAIVVILLLFRGGLAFVPLLVGQVTFVVVGMIAAAALGLTLPSPQPVLPSTRSTFPGQGLLSRLGMGLQQQLAKVTKWTTGLLDSRQREIERLKKLLDEDPDEGLKYALPFGGDAGRGVAAPTGWLSQRLIDFQLGALASRGPADHWDLPPNTQFELITRYRQLAAREVQLGRYRRAAYIFAELLGDLNTAAVTLVNGRFYREAAVLYRDKLNRPLEAANCLEQGGLLAEAIPLYRQQGKIEMVGDLYRRLDDETQAKQAYQEAVDVAVSKQDHLDAARLYQEKLDSPDEALNTLDAGWPHTNQSKQCLDASFVLLAKLGRHDETIHRIKALQQAQLESKKVVDAADVLATTATRSPHANSRVVAADTVRILAARALINKQEHRQQLIAAVGRLAPEDRLLTRDCQRATQQSFSTQQQKTISRRRSSVPEMRLVQTFQLPSDVTWTSAISTDRNFYAVGHKPGEVIVARGAWNDPNATVSSLSWNVTADSSNVLIGHSTTERSLFIHSSTKAQFSPRGFDATDSNPDFEKALTPSWMPESISAIAASPQGTIYTFQLMKLLLCGFSGSGAPLMIETPKIPIQSESIKPHEIFPMVAFDDAVLLAVGPHLIESHCGQAPKVEQMRGRITSLAASPPNSERQLAILFEEGGQFVWGNLNSRKYHQFAIQVENPRATILRGNHLVVHGTGSWRIYQTSGEKIQRLHELPCDIQHSVFGLLRPGTARQVGLCTTDGQVRVFELP
ncbi:MAG: hypothetical protein V4719_03610 [Planctomycetota bacterium]